MTLAEIHQLRTDAKSAIQARGRGGPKTEAGKLRSSLNAVRHGLAAVHMLLPGEDRAEYERRMDGVFTSLAPQDEAQAQLIALIADELWRLDRLSRIEQGLLVARNEELLALMPSSGGAGALANAITALGSALVIWEEPPMPREPSVEFERRLAAMRSAFEVMRTADGLPSDLVGDVEKALMTLLEDPASDSMVEKAFALHRAAKVLIGHMLKKAEEMAARQDEQRKAIATVALPDEKELKKLTRYRKTLEEGLQRRLAALEQLRTLSAAAAGSGEASAATAREYRVKLRLVV